MPSACGCFSTVIAKDAAEVLQGVLAEEGAPKGQSAGGLVLKESLV